MKHEEIYNTVRRLIDEREVGEDNLATAQERLFELVESDPECAWACGLLSEIYYWSGEYADPEDKLEFFEAGVEYGKQGVAIDPDSLESNFWLSANYGSYGQEKGIMQSLALVHPIKEAAEKAIELNEAYFYGGPWRVLGRLYHKAPGFPFSIGNTKKGIECLEKAVALGPRFFLNRLFLAEACISNRDRAKAREQLEWIVATPSNKNHEFEDDGYKRDAEALLEKL
ncbi:MAG: hypothetical protein JSS81_15790 [Acidobacteria bacterium]|nr:hypothetical protein [Acidobacteriota bacterium]